jgi:nitronate monooxygenase
MLPEFAGGEDPYVPYFEVCAEEKVPVVETAGRSPGRFVPMLKEAGVRILHKVPTVRFARKAESLGVDAVTVVGFECGGHPGQDDVGSLVLLRRAASELRIPLVAAGGFADGAGIAAALALGASGVLMGTRFVATTECPIHDVFKRRLLELDERSTLLILRSIHNTARVMRNAAAERVLEAEGRGAGLDEILPLVAGSFGREAYVDGEIDKAVVACSQAVGLIRDIPTVAELMRRLVDETADACHRLGGLVAE